MTPVHANVEESTGYQMVFDVRQGPGKKVRKLSLGHFPDAHWEFPMYGLAFAAHMTIDRDVVRRIGKGSRSPFIFKELVVGGGV